MLSGASVVTPTAPTCLALPCLILSLSGLTRSGLTAVLRLSSLSANILADRLKAFKSLTKAALAQVQRLPEVNRCEVLRFDTTS